MPPKCTVCYHPKVDDINKLIVSGHLTNRVIAGKYGLTYGSIDRHKQNHLLKQLASVSKLKEEKTTSLLDKCEALLKDALDILEKAKSANKYRQATSAIREARGCLELLGRVSGEIQDGAKINIMMNPSWTQIRTVLLDNLQPYPDAREQVAHALAQYAAGNGNHQQPVIDVTPS